MIDVRRYNRAGTIANVQWVMPPYRDVVCSDCGARFYMDAWGMEYTHACAQSVARVVKAEVDKAVSAALASERSKA